MKRETWKILQVMRVNADRRLHIAPQFAGEKLAVRNALDLSDAVVAHLKVNLSNITGALAGSGRTYTGTVPGTEDAIIVTLQRIEEAA